MSKTKDLSRRWSLRIIKDWSHTNSIYLIGVPSIREKTLASNREHNATKAPSGTGLSHLRIRDPKSRPVPLTKKNTMLSGSAGVRISDGMANRWSAPGVPIALRGTDMKPNTAWGLLGLEHHRCQCHQCHLCHLCHLALPEVEGVVLAEKKPEEYADAIRCLKAIWSIFKKYKKIARIGDV